MGTDGTEAGASLRGVWVFGFVAGTTSTESLFCCGCVSSLCGCCELLCFGATVAMAEMFCGAADSAAGPADIGALGTATGVAAAIMDVAAAAGSADAVVACGAPFAGGLITGASSAAAMGVNTAWKARLGGALLPPVLACVGCDVTDDEKNAAVGGPDCSACGGTGGTEEETTGVKVGVSAATIGAGASMAATFIKVASPLRTAFLTTGADAADVTPAGAGTGAAVFAEGSEDEFIFCASTGRLAWPEAGIVAGDDTSKNDPLPNIERIIASAICVGVADCGSAVVVEATV